jgi:hypothetical protein
MDRAAGVESIGVGGNAAHRVDRDRAANHYLVLPPRCVGPALVQHYRLIERDLRNFRCDPPNSCGRNAATRGHGFGREFGRQITFGRMGECWLRRSSNRKSKRAEKSGVGTEGLGIHEAIRSPIVGKRLAPFIAGEEPMIGVTGRVNY